MKENTMQAILSVVFQVLASFFGGEGGLGDLSTLLSDFFGGGAA
jgi:hypothetical protein